MGEVSSAMGIPQVFPGGGMLAVLLVDNQLVAAADFQFFVGDKVELGPFLKRTLPANVEIVFVPARQALKKYPELEGEMVYPFSDIGDNRGWYSFASIIFKKTGFSYGVCNSERDRVIFGLK